MQAPSRDPGDLYIANRAETALFIPEKAKDTGTPKRFSHVSFFAFFEGKRQGKHIIDEYRLRFSTDAERPRRLG